ncbi:MAG: putative adenylate/guanylate cyclase, partial [Chloroflexi bacterium]|nr:putative adenylate/guanylate cyclase [Chloroflexota bacterium]
GAMTFTMHRRFRALLPEASGASEHVITAFVDIRGFSSFNERVESVESAAYIKRVYLAALDGYFRDASFFKSTGDGLMIIWAVDEARLLERAKVVLEASLRFVDDFATLVVGDPIINFEVPRLVGIGLGRGAASRLSSARTILDYSGRLLNATARLMDLARPEGIVVNSNYGLQRLDAALLDLFESADVYLRGVAETAPISIHYLKGRTVIPQKALHPIAEERWEEVTTEIKYSTFKAMRGTYTLELPSQPEHEMQVKVFHRHTVGGDKFVHWHTLAKQVNYQLVQDGARWSLRIHPLTVVPILAGCEVLDDKLKFRAVYRA